MNLYQEVLRKTLENRCNVKSVIIDLGSQLNLDQEAALECMYTAVNVKRVLMSFPNDKALGIDGYNSYFFKQR